MMNMMRKSMERMMDIVPSALEAVRERVANETEGNNGSSKDPARMDLAIDIELMPMIVPLQSQEAAEKDANKTTIINPAGFVGGKRGVVIIEMNDALKAARVSSNSSKVNGSLISLLEQASSKAAPGAGLQADTTNGKTGTSDPGTQSSKASARNELPSSDVRAAAHRGDSPKVLASQLDPSEPRAANASWASADAMAPAEGFSAACYGLFLRHGMLLLVLAIVCGVCCLLGTLLPVVCDRRSSGQRSQFPSKKLWSPHRIFADPNLVRMFRRRGAMMA
ncbi:unnamed protein product [Ixodes hexagonus]